MVCLKSTYAEERSCLYTEGKQNDQYEHLAEEAVGNASNKETGFVCRCKNTYIHPNYSKINWSMKLKIFGLSISSLSSG